MSGLRERPALTEAEAVEWFDRMWAWIDKRYNAGSHLTWFGPVLSTARVASWHRLRAEGPEGTAEWWWESRPDEDPSPYRKRRVQQPSLFGGPA